MNVNKNVYITGKKAAKILQFTGCLHSPGNTNQVRLELED